jgi:acetyltransferase-like isoleucine patch superfamily enzyme
MEAPARHEAEAMSETVRSANLRAPGKAATVSRWQRRLLLALANRIAGLTPPTQASPLLCRLYRRAGLEVGRDVRLVGGIQLSARIRIGDDSAIETRTLLYTGTVDQGGEIRIGRGVTIGPRCCLLTGTHEVGGAERRCGPSQYKDIEIGDGCWIGANVTITAGVTIGPGCVVEAGSVVAQNLPANALAAGSPARVLRTLEG